jgi:methionyl-tRNA formyltransferase
MRVAVFGSFYRGYYVLGELLYGPCKDLIKVVGVATDDPAQHYINAKNRVWKYPHSQREEIMVADLARDHDIPVYREKIKTENFYDIFEKKWKPDLCLMATFGQLINLRLIKFPQLGFYNFHPSDIGDWPSRYAGCNPFEAMFKQGEKICTITLHEVNEEFDQGGRVACSDAIMIPPGVTVTDMHKISAPVAACLLRKMLPGLLRLSP